MKTRVRLMTKVSRLCCLLLLLATAGNAVPLAAQTRRTPSKAQTQTASQPKRAQTCSAAWTGRVTYARTQSDSNSKTVPRVSGRGEDKTDFQLSYNYRATVAVVEAPEKNGSSVGKANINHKLTSSETVVAKESNSCDRGKTWQVMSGTSTSKTETQGNASGVEA